MDHELLSHLRDIQDRFMINHANGGLAAVEQMVQDLAVEAEGARAFADGAQDVQHDAIMAQDTADPTGTVGTVALAHEVSRDNVAAMSRHSFASFLLSIVKEEQ